MHKGSTLHTQAFPVCRHSRIAQTPRFSSHAGMAQQRRARTLPETTNYATFNSHLGACLVLGIYGANLE